MAKNRFFDIFTSFSLEHGPFFSTWWPSQENAKKIIFFAEMAFTHVGTKYIKRPWDFENFLDFWCTLVHIAIGCHPKQAALLTAPLLRRLEELVRRPGAVAVGECGLDYSARWCVRYPDFVLPSATQEFRWQEGAGPCISSSDPIGTSLQPASSSPRQGSGQVLGGVPSWRRLLPDSGWVQCAKEFSHS